MYSAEGVSKNRLGRNFRVDQGRFEFIHLELVQCLRVDKVCLDVFPLWRTVRVNNAILMNALIKGNLYSEIRSQDMRLILIIWRYQSENARNECCFMNGYDPHRRMLAERQRCRVHKQKAYHGLAEISIE